MGLYDDSDYPVRADLDVIHARQLQQFAEPGTWGSGAQRIAVANEARKAGYAAGILERPEDGGAESGVSFPDAVCEAIHTLAAAPKDFDQTCYDKARSAGLSEEEFVEIAGIVSRIVDLDVFARGIGVALRPLPEPQRGQPSRQRPATARKEQAWVATVPNPPEGGAIADELYGGHPKPYIVRGLSLVPDEMKRHLELEEVQYLPLRNILDPTFRQHEGLDRAQVEVVAGRVSAINACFY